MGEIYYLCTHKSETGTALRATYPIYFVRVFDKFALINQRRAPLFVNSKLKLRKFLTDFYPT